MKKSKNNLNTVTRSDLNQSESVILMYEAS